MPEHIEISEIHATPDGKVLLHPTGKRKDTYQYVYRAAMSVSWDNETNAFVAKQKNDGNIIECVKRIIMAVSKELGISLYLTKETKYSSIAQPIQTDLLAMR